MLWNITIKYMENKSRCWGILLENTLNRNMEWKILLENIWKTGLNVGEHCCTIY